MPDACMCGSFVGMLNAQTWYYSTDTCQIAWQSTWLHEQWQFASHFLQIQLLTDADTQVWLIIGLQAWL